MTQKKVSLAKIPLRSRQAAPKQKARPGFDKAGRALDYDILTPQGAPQIVRVKIRTPITPQAVRRQLLDAVSEYPEDVRASELQQRLTPLDRHLGDDIVAALETYVAVEDGAGRVKAASWDVQVQTSGNDRNPLPEARAKAATLHEGIKRRLSRLHKKVLAIFCQQMNGGKGAPNNFEAASYCAPEERFDLQEEQAQTKRQRKAIEDAARQRWYNLLKSAGERLLQLEAEIYAEKRRGKANERRR